MADSIDQQATENFYIVGVGASAGGLEALEEFFDNVREFDRFAFVVVQHLSPDYKSLMGELLSRHTDMPIHQAEDGIQIEPGNIYLIPRKKNMTMYHSQLFLHEQEHGLNLPIDIFLSSLAEDQGERSVGIVLSGTGSDGTRGIRKIKEMGGMVMVQDEESARFDGMPRSAIATGIVDYVLPPHRMSEELLNFVNGTISITKATGTPDITSKGSLAKILALIRSKAGVDLSYYKETTILRRIERRMGINQIDNLHNYVLFLEEYPSEIQTLFKEILIGVTRFFRDMEAFDTVKDKVLPQLLNNKNSGEPIRVWVAACSTGEEAYGLAIIFHEFMKENELSNELKIFATDIDRDAIEFASYGVYPESIAADSSMERLGKYFIKKGESYQIIPDIREKVIFAYHNVFKDPPFSRIDLISCRNLLIYFQPILQKKVLTNFQFSLNDDGFLFLGSSETVGDMSSVFTIFDTKWKIYSFVGRVRPKELDMSMPEYNRHTIGGEHTPKASYRTAQSKGLEVLYEQLIERYIPPSVLVNGDRVVQHIFGDVNDYLRLPLGKLNLDVLKMAREELSIPLGTALYRAMSEKTITGVDDVAITVGEQARLLNITISPIMDEYNTFYYIITFNLTGETVDPDRLVEKFNLEESVQRRIYDLEKELQYTKENLQATIEELETSNEELQATNEELIASNEELQSTNEELQSVNEELITVNSEYQKKIEELTELNDDMNNLLASTEIGTVFLDSGMTIRKFTPPATAQINIIKSDIGRPVQHFSHNLKYDTFIEDIQSVIENLESKQVEVESQDDKWFLIKIAPYRSGVDRVSGAVISFVDITGRVRAQEALTRHHDLMERVLESLPQAVTMVQADGKLTFVNSTAEKLFGITREQLQKRKFNDKKFSILDRDGKEIPEKELPFSIIMNSGNAVKDYVHYVVLSDGEKKLLSISGSPVYNLENEVEGGVFIVDEIDDNQ